SLQAGISQMKTMSLDQVGRYALLITYGILILKAVLKLAELVIGAKVTTTVGIDVAIQLERVLFVGMMAAFTFVRLPAKNKSTWETRIVGIAGSFLTLG